MRLIFEKGIENEQIERSNKDNIWSFQTKVVKEIQFSTWVVNKSFQEKTTKQNDIAIFKQSKIFREPRSSSYKEHRVNALASGAEEGRDKLR